MSYSRKASFLLVALWWVCLSAKAEEVCTTRVDASISAAGSALLQIARSKETLRKDAAPQPEGNEVVLQMAPVGTNSEKLFKMAGYDLSGYHGSPDCVPDNIAKKNRRLGILALQASWSNLSQMELLSLNFFEFLEANTGDVGATAALDGAGFKLVTSLCCPSEMEAFISRLLESLRYNVCSKPHMQGLMHWFSCVPDMDFEYVLSIIADGNPCKYWAPFGQSCPVLSDACSGHFCAAPTDNGTDAPTGTPTEALTIAAATTPTPVTTAGPATTPASTTIAAAGTTPAPTTSAAPATTPAPTTIAATGTTLAQTTPATPATNPPWTTTVAAGRLLSGGVCSVGDEVLARWAGNGHRYHAIIASIDASSITVNWDDGGITHRIIPADDVANLGKCSGGGCSVGDEVKAQWAGDGHTYKAIIDSIDGSSITVNWNDGRTTHRIVPADHVQKGDPKSCGDSGGDGGGDGAIGDSGGICSVADEVEALWAGDGHNYHAIIASIDGSSITVNWNDGDSTHRIVPADDVQKDGKSCGESGVAP